MIELSSDRVSVKYDNENKIASGGYCTVFPVVEYDGRDESGLVLKRLKRSTSINNAFERVEEEVRLLKILNGGGGSIPEVVLSYAPGGNSRQPWYVMEKLKPLVCDSFKDALRIIGDVAQALSYVHGKGIAHRDIKQDNILMRDNGSVVLCDFSVSVDVNSPDSVFNFCSPLHRFDVPSELFETRIESSIEKGLMINIFQSSDLYMFGYVVHELLTDKELDKSSFTYVSFIEDVKAYFRTSVNEDAIALLFDLILKATASQYRNRCPLLFFMETLDKIRSEVLPHRMSVGTISEIARIKRRSAAVSNVTVAREVIFDASLSRKDVDEILSASLKDTLFLLRDMREISSSDVRIENAVLTFKNMRSDRMFEISKLHYYNDSEDYPVFKIVAEELSVGEFDLKRGSVSGYSCADVIFVFSPEDKERYHNGEENMIVQKCINAEA